MNRAPLMFLSLLLSWTLLACELAPPVEDAGAVDLTRAVSVPLKLRQNDAAPPKESSPEEAQRLKEYNELLDKFLERQDDAFSSTETDNHLSGIEEMASLTSRTFDLIHAYRRAYDKHGPSHFTAARLTWAYVNIGHNELARQTLDASLKERPQDARLHFIHGFLVGREKEINAVTVREVQASWKKALELDPSLRNLYGVQASVVQDRLKQIDQALANEPPPSEAPPQAPPDSQPAQPVDGAALPADGAAPADGGPTDAPGLIVQGERLLAEGDPKGAFRDFTKALQLAPDDPRAVFGQAVAGWRAIGKDDPQAAKGLLRRIVDHPALSARQRYELGMVFVREAGDKPQGVALWEKAKAQDPALAQELGLDKLIQDNR